METKKQRTSVGIFPKGSNNDFWVAFLDEENIRLLKDIELGGEIHLNHRMTPEGKDAFTLKVLPKKVVDEKRAAYKARTENAPKSEEQSYI